MVGRELETAELFGLLDAAPLRGGAVVLRAEAGMGKTALLELARARAVTKGFDVLATGGVQSEIHLAFAGLHALLHRVLPEIERLPPPQREAVLAAFGLTDAVVPDLFLVALAVLQLLGESADGSPRILLVDDVQWLDRPTVDVLAFVARRIEADPIVLVAAHRDGHRSALLEAGLPELRLGPLDDSDAAVLLDARAPELPRSARDRLLREAAGNPLALIELPAALRSAGLTGTTLPAWLPLTERLERAFAARLTGLPEATRALLLVAAAAETGESGELARAAGRLLGRDVSLEAAEPAAERGLVESTATGIRFRHPLIRSAVYQTARPAEQRAAHAALAAGLERSPDRRAWHRAAAVTGTDEAVAADLEAAAERAERRGGVAAAVTALERAARLTGDPRARGPRLLRAAELAFDLGRLEDVGHLLGEAGSLDLAPRDLARVAWIREMLGAGTPGDPTRLRALVATADRMSMVGAPDLALRLLWAAASSGFWADRGAEVREEILAAADRATVPDDDPQLLSVLAYAAPIQRGAVVMERVRARVPDPAGDPVAMMLVGNSAATVGAFDLAEGFLAVSERRLREQGRLYQLSQVLVLRSWTWIHLGRWEVARADAEEAVRLAGETGQPIWSAGGRVAESMLAGLRGEIEEAETAAADAERIGLTFGARAVLAVVQLARGLTALGAGRREEAWDHLLRLFDPADPASHHMESCWAIGHLAEAAIQSGHRDEAHAILERMEPLARQTPSTWFHVAMRHARPLLADESDAEPLFRRALDADLTRWPFDRARLELAYGQWLRRQRRVAEARPPLRAARDAFDALGAVPWGERAREELRASGETSRRRATEARDALSPQELRIARMAADGMSNKEIGGQLYLSHRTVGSHLYRLFPKLGITSRSQLRGALESRPKGPDAA